MGDFQEEGNSPFERRLRAFMNREDMANAMVVATDLGHPAVVGIAEPLLAEFKEELDSDHHRQLVGSVAREIMEPKGYVIDQTNVRVTTYPFTKATRYRHRDAVALHVFRASGDPREVCIGLTRDASAFPPAPKGGKWTYWTTITNKLQAAIGFGIMDLKREVEAIEKHGHSRRRVERLLRRG